MFIGVILCNLIVVLLAFCGVVNVYNCLTSMEQEMGVDVFMESFVPACIPLFMAACLFMLVQIACQIQRMNIELKMQRGSDVPSSSAASARTQARKPNRAAPDAEATRDYFSLEDERKPSRANRSPRPVDRGTRPLKTPPAQPPLDAWSGSSERFGASSSVLPARAAAVVAASPASAAPSAEPSASPAAAATAGSASVAGAPTSSPEDWPAAPSPEARPAASSPGARVAASSPVDRPAAQTSAPSRSEDATSDGKGGTSSSGSSASRTKRSSSPSFFSLD